jgi:hypothetical protein
MMTIEQQLRELADIPMPVPARLAQQAWATGRRQRRRHARFGVGVAVLAAGVTLGVVAAHPALADTSSTSSASSVQHLPAHG